MDDVLTLTEPIIDINGKAIHELYIPKGTDVLIPNRYLNCNTTHWGEDAHEFNPERWLKKDSDGDSESSSASVLKRIWTFGEGARSCVGKQFSMAQMKVSSFWVFFSSHPGFPDRF